MVNDSGLQLGMNNRVDYLEEVYLKQLLCSLFLLFFKLTDTETGPRFKKGNREQVENV